MHSYINECLTKEIKKVAQNKEKSGGREGGRKRERRES